MAGQLRVDEITDEAGTGSPSFPQGIQPNSLGTGTPGAGNFLRGDGAWEAVPPGSPPGTLELLQEDIFTTSGTWTKDTGYDPDDTVMIFLVGAGGGGGAAKSDSGSEPTPYPVFGEGGLCGSVGIFSAQYSDVSGTFSFVAGAGGAGITVTASESAGDGTKGGNSELYVGASAVSANLMGTAFGGDAGRGQISGAEITRSRRAQTTNQHSFISKFVSRGASGADTNRVNLLQSNSGGITASNSYSASNQRPLPFNACGSGGNGSVSTSGSWPSKVAVDRPFFNTPLLGFLKNNGGAGSGTANGQTAIGIGGGGGGCARINANAVSGAGGNGCLIVRYYRGAVGVDQIINRAGT